MKKLAVAFLVVAAACSRDLTKPDDIHPGCSLDNISTVRVTPASATLNSGDAITLQSTLSCYGRVLWSSSNSSVATVDSSGTVRAISPGTVTIVAASGPDPAVKGAALITVNGVRNTGAEVVLVSINDASGPANLTSVSGPVDVGIQVTVNTTNVLAADLIINRGQDTVVATVEAPVPVPNPWKPTLRWNTAQSTNGSYLLIARVLDKSTGISINTTSQQITVKNP
jgi:alpha-amylase